MGVIDLATLLALTSYTNTSLVADFAAFTMAAPACVSWYSSIIQLSLCDACTESSTSTVPTRLGGNASYGIAQNVCNKAVTTCSPVWYFLWKASWLAQAASYLAYYNGNTTSYTTGAGEFYTQGTGANAFPTAMAVSASLTSCVNATSVGTGCLATDANILCSAFINIVGGAQNANATVTGVGATGTAYYSASALRRRLTVAAADGSVYIDGSGIDITTGMAAAPFTGTPATSVAYAVSATGPSSYPTLSTASWSTGYVYVSNSSSNNNSTGTNNSTTTGSSAQVLLGSIISAFLALALLN